MANLVGHENGYQLNVYQDNDKYLLESGQSHRYGLFHGYGSNDGHTIEGFSVFDCKTEDAAMEELRQIANSRAPAKEFSLYQ